jgi:shikimate kinase
MVEKNVVLIGFMGTGKSTVGKLLAKRLGWPWVDVDQRIEESQKKKVVEIFDKEGEAQFRRLEKDMVRLVSAGSRQVITTGGGAVLDTGNIEALKKNGMLIALSATPETLYQRLKDSRYRPLLKSGDLMGEIRRLLEERRPFYEKADATFRTDGKTAAEVAQAIAESLEKEEEFEFGKDWF